MSFDTLTKIVIEGIAYHPIHIPLDWPIREAFGIPAVIFSWGSEINPRHLYHYQYQRCKAKWN